MPNLAKVQRIPRNWLIPGVVVWAHVPFEGDDGEKTRPAVIDEVRGRDVTLLPATTSLTRERFPGRYVEIEDLAAAGFSRPTAIRTSPVTVDVIEIISIAGVLSAVDAQRVVLQRGEVA